MLVLGALAGSAYAKGLVGAGGPLGGITTPGISTPAVTVPAVTVPAVTVPTVTVPAVTVPAVTTPVATTPAVTTPAVTPQVSTPPVTTPAVTSPTVATPKVVLPPVKVPAVTAPVKLPTQSVSAAVTSATKVVAKAASPALSTVASTAAKTTARDPDGRDTRKAGGDQAPAQAPCRSGPETASSGQDVDGGSVATTASATRPQTVTPKAATSAADVTTAAATPLGLDQPPFRELPRVSSTGLNGFGAGVGGTSGGAGTLTFAPWPDEPIMTSGFISRFLQFGTSVEVCHRSSDGSDGTGIHDGFLGESRRRRTEAARPRASRPVPIPDGGSEVRSDASH